MNDLQNKRKRRVTIKDVAEAAGVSIATVSYVLNNTPGQSISEETRKKVLQFANLLGYECNVMARYLATGKTNTVGAVVKDMRPFASRYYMKLLCELSRLLFRQNLGLRLVDYSDGMSKSGDCDACVTVSLTEPEFRAFAETKYVPVIAIDSIFDDFLFYRINDDYELLAGIAASEYGNAPVSLLTYELPDEVYSVARRVFSDIVTVKTVKDIAELDAKKNYVTVSSYLCDNAKCLGAHVRLRSSSFAFKASAAAECLTKAMNRTIDDAEDHNVKV